MDRPEMQLAVNCALHRRLFIRSRLARRYYFLSFMGYVDEKGNKIPGDYEDDAIYKYGTSREDWTKHLDSVDKATPVSLHNILLICDWCDGGPNACEHIEEFHLRVRKDKEYNVERPVPTVELPSPSVDEDDEPPSDVEESQQLPPRQRRNVILKNMPLHISSDRITKFFRKRKLPVHRIAQLSVKGKKVSYKISTDQDEAANFIKITEICGHRTEIVLFRKKHEVVQCYLCNQHGHTAAECKRKPVCLFCGRDHSRRECTMKPDTKHCVNCDQDGHLATSRSCTVFKQLREKSKPAPQVSTSQRNQRTARRTNNPSKTPEEKPAVSSKQSIASVLAAITQALCLLLQEEPRKMQLHRARRRRSPNNTRVTH